MSELLDRYCGMNRVGTDGRTYRILTREVHIQPGIGWRVAELSRTHLGGESGKVALVCDENTRAVAGGHVEAGFARSGRPFEVIQLAPTRGRHTVVCDDETMDEVTALVSAAGVVGAVAIGSGTLSDLVKMSSHRLGIPCVSMVTAPSNNGYTSSIAAILSKGVKITQPCTPVVAVYADPEVVRNAPYRMIASGIGDLYSKPVSNADWRLSARLLGSFYSSIVMELVDAGSALLEGVAPRLPSRDPDAVSRLTEAIMISGMAMQAAGSSGPASGGEHLVSHYLDMTCDIDGEPHDFHGCQVAVGTIVTATLYEDLTRLDPSAIDIEARVAALPPWDGYRDLLQARFGVLTEAVVAHARRAYPTPAALRERLTKLVEEWDDILPWVGETLRPSAELAAELESAQCPVRFDQIGVSRPRAQRAVVHCKDIRDRYTILHLLWELGELERLGAGIVERQFA